MPLYESLSNLTDRVSTLRVLAKGGQAKVYYLGDQSVLRVQYFTKSQRGKRQYLTNTERLLYHMSDVDVSPKVSSFTIYTQQNTTRAFSFVMRRYDMDMKVFLKGQAGEPWEECFYNLIQKASFHRYLLLDIKPENVVITKNPFRMKLIDINHSFCRKRPDLNPTTLVFFNLLLFVLYCKRQKTDMALLYSKMQLTLDTCGTDLSEHFRSPKIRHRFRNYQHPTVWVSQFLQWSLRPRPRSVSLREPGDFWKCKNLYDCPRGDLPMSKIKSVLRRESRGHHFCSRSVVRCFLIRDGDGDLQYVRPLDSQVVRWEPTGIYFISMCILLDKLGLADTHPLTPPSRLPKMWQKKVKKKRYRRAVCRMFNAGHENSPAESATSDKRKVRSGVKYL